MNRGKLSALLIITVLAAVLLSGCQDNTCCDDQTYMYIKYEAYYDTPLNIELIEEVLSENNISFESRNTYTDVISFSYGRGYNNVSVEPSYGILYPNQDINQYEAFLSIELDGSEYPRPHWIEDYDSVFEERKPLLEESLDYIIGLIYNATGFTPVHKEFVTGEGSQIE